MSDLPDGGIWAGIGAVIGGAIVGGKKVLSLFTKKPEQLPEPSINATRIGEAHRRIDRLETETMRMRQETAEKLADIYESLDGLKQASATTSAILPRVEKQLDALMEEMRQDRRRKD